MRLAARPRRFLALLRKNPVERMSASTSSGSPAARLAGSGKRLKKAGVVTFTRASVHWALSTVATTSW